MKDDKERKLKAADVVDVQPMPEEGIGKHGTLLRDLKFSADATSSS